MGAVGESKPHKKYGGLSDMFSLYYCPICGKEFVVSNTAEYVYKKHDGERLRYCCSYGCKRKLENKLAERRELEREKQRQRREAQKARQKALERAVDGMEQV